MSRSYTAVPIGTSANVFKITILSWILRSKTSRYKAGFCCHGWTLGNAGVCMSLIKHSFRISVVTGTIGPGVAPPRSVNRWQSFTMCVSQKKNLLRTGMWPPPSYSILPCCNRTAVQICSCSRLAGVMPMLEGWTNGSITAYQQGNTMSVQKASYPTIIVLCHV